MTIKIHLLPSRHEFAHAAHETLLESALRAGLTVNYGCNNGACGACKGRLISGALKKLRHSDYPLSEVERQQGHFLLCSHAATCDATIELMEAHGARDIPRQEIQCKVRKVEMLSADVLLLHLRTPRSKTLRFIAGQHVQLALDRDVYTVHSIASCPCDNMNLQFHIRHSEHEEFFAYAKNLTASDSLAIKGPSGEFLLDETSARPLLFIAFDTGFAPVKSLIEQAMALDLEQPLQLYWLTLFDDGCYMHNYCRSLSDALDNFRYTPLSINKGSSTPSSTREYRTRLQSFLCSPQAVDHALTPIIAPHLDMSPYDIYMAAPHSFVHAARERFVKHGLPKDRLFVEEIDQIKA